MRAPTDRPNIIVILCDDLGYGDLGCYGSELHATPRLDQAAAEGARFTQLYAGAPVCSPSRAALMTGCYPQRIGLGAGEDFLVLMPGDPVGLHPREMSLATMLEAHGYRTAAIGKWHLGDQQPFLPLQHGFDHYFGLPYSNDMSPATNVSLTARGYDMPDLPLIRDRSVCEAEPDQASLTDRYTNEALRFIDENAEEPFFLYLAHMYVHAPIHVPESYLAASRNGPYGAAVEHIDASTGAILDRLASLGIDENTLLVFTSDNGAGSSGGGSNAPLRGWKASTWEGGVREPGICRWPGQIAAGSERNEITAFMDLLPTIAEISGASPPAERLIDGRSFAGLLLGSAGA